MSDKPLEQGFVCEKHGIGYVKKCPTCLYEESQAKYPEICPMTGWGQWGEIQLPNSSEYVMTYYTTPAYNSYSIPRLDDEGLVFEWHNYDHDEGNWKDDSPEHYADLQEVLISLLETAAAELPESHKWLKDRIDYVLSEVERVENEME